MKGDKVHLVNKDNEPICNQRNASHAEVPEERLTTDVTKVTCGNCKQSLNRS